MSDAKKCESVNINGAKYIREDLVNVAEFDGMTYCIVRCKNAGVHAGFLKERKSGEDVKLVRTRRLWRWWGKTLSGLAKDGTFKPENCKFSDEIGEIVLLWPDPCEIIPCTQVGMESIRSVKNWENE